MDHVARRNVLRAAVLGGATLAAGRILPPPASAAGAAARRAARPVPALGPWVGAGPFRHVLDPSVPGASRYLNDHTAVRGPDGRWHLFGITGERVPPGQVPDSGLEDSLAHASAPALTGPWTNHADVLHVDPDYHGEQHLWAPHVVESDGVWHMFYAAGGAHGAAINLATSTDLVTWERWPDGPLFRGIVARDPMVLRIGDQWVMYYTEVTAPGGHHVVAHRTSRDLVRWSGAGIAFEDPTTEATVSITESPYVVESGGRFHLFLGPRNGYVGTDVFRSDDPFRFTLDGWSGHVPGHAVEVVRDGDAWWATAAGWFQRGLHVAELEWRDTPTPWQSPANPAVGLGVGDRAHVFALGTDGSVLHRSETGAGTWSRWRDFGAVGGAVPTLGRNRDGRLEVFLLTSGGDALRHRAQRADGGWEPWRSFGGAAGSSPAVACNADGRLEVFALGPGGRNVAHRRQAAPGSADWEAWNGRYAGPAGAPPVVAANLDGRLEVFLLAPGGQAVDHRWQTAPGGTGWSAWTSFGTAAGAAPTVARDGTGRLVVTTISPSGTGSFSRRQAAPSSVWDDWRWQHHWPAASPALAADASGRVHAFVLAPGGDRLTCTRQDVSGTGWESPTEVGEPDVLLSAEPAVLLDGDGRLLLVAVTADGEVRSRRQASSGAGWEPWSRFGDVTVAAVPAGSPT